MKKQPLKGLREKFRRLLTEPTPSKFRQTVVPVALRLKVPIIKKVYPDQA